MCLLSGGNPACGTPATGCSTSIVTMASMSVASGRSLRDTGSWTRWVSGLIQRGFYMFLCSVGDERHTCLIELLGMSFFWGGSCTFALSSSLAQMIAGM